MLQLSLKRINTFKKYYVNNPKALNFICNIIDKYGEEKAGLILASKPTILPSKTPIYSLDGQSLSTTLNLSTLPNDNGFHILTSPQNFNIIENRPFVMNIEISGTFTLPNGPMGIGVTSTPLTNITFSSLALASTNGFYLTLNGVLYYNSLNKILPNTSYDYTINVPERAKVSIFDNDIQVGFGSSMSNLNYTNSFEPYRYSSSKYLSFIFPVNSVTPSTGSITITMNPTV